MAKKRASKKQIAWRKKFARMAKSGKFKKKRKKSAIGKSKKSKSDIVVTMKSRNGSMKQNYSSEAAAKKAINLLRKHSLTPVSFTMTKEL